MINMGRIVRKKGRGTQNFLRAAAFFIFIKSLIIKALYKIPRTAGAGINSCFDSVEDYRQIRLHCENGIACGGRYTDRRADCPHRTALPMGRVSD